MNYKLFVCITTIPSRIERIFPCIDSLVNQKYMPYKIIISIPNKYIRFNDTVKDDFLDKLIDKYSCFFNCDNDNILKINKINEDYGPGTKLLGVLDLPEIYNDSYIVLADDDVMYQNYFLKDFNYFLQQNNGIGCASYNTYQLHDITIGQGVDGFMIPKRYLNSFKFFFNKIKCYDNFIFHDDVYISYYLFLLGININNINIDNMLIYIVYNDNNALFFTTWHILNADKVGGNECKCNVTTRICNAQMCKMDKNDLLYNNLNKIMIPTFQKMYNNGEFSTITNTVTIKDVILFKGVKYIK